jgi:DNA polymerase-3 subunit gamma/tau
MSCIDILTSSASNMKLGANRRTTAELCIIRLCTPALDNDINALLRRVSELESAVKNGVVVNSAPQKVEEKIEQPEKVDEKEVSQPKVVEKVVEKAVEKLVEEPKPVVKAEEKPAIKAEAPKAAPAKQNGTIPFTQWPEVLEKIFEKDKSLIVMLSGSQAFVHNETYLLIKGSAVLEMYLKTGDYSKIIKQAVAQVTGKNYTLAVYNNKQEETPKSPLSDLVSKARELGVNVKEE